jgi:hypothetical protein
MTRQQMIDVLVTQLMLSREKKDKENAIELILRQGWRGFNNYSDAELIKEVDQLDTKRVEGLLLCAEILKGDLIA